MRFVRFVLSIAAAILASATLAFAGDNFPGTTVTGINTSFSASNVGATGETGEPATFGGGNVNTMWYSWTAPGNGSVTFETCGNPQTTFDTTLAAYVGTAVNALGAALASNDDTTGCAVTVNANYGSRITWNVTEGTVYRIQVDGYGNAAGTFRLTYRFTGFTITKSASVSSIAAPGTITYTINVANAGYIALTGTTISDALLLSGSGRTLTSGPTLISGDAAPLGTLGTTETWVYQATFAVPQSDIDLGGTYSNTATFDTAQTLPATSNAATTSITQTPVFTNTKSQISGPNPVTAAGAIIGYSIVIANTGNVTLTAPTLVSDTFELGGSPRTLFAGPSYVSGDSDSDGNIDVGESWHYSATYLVPQTDIDGTGDYANTATFDTAQTAALASNTVTTSITRTPALAIDKTYVITTDGGGAGVADLGDVITYTYAVTNSGNVTINGVSVSDVHSGAGSLSAITPASVASLAPGASTNFTATYTAVQTDIDNQ